MDDMRVFVFEIRLADDLICMMFVIKQCKCSLQQSSKQPLETPECEVVDSQSHQEQPSRTQIQTTQNTTLFPTFVLAPN